MDMLQRERPLQDIVGKMKALKLARQQMPSVKDKSPEFQEISSEINQLQKQFEELAGDIYANLSCYQITQLSRHPSRPYTLDILSQLCSDFIELHGDRNFSDDTAIITGIGFFKGQRAVLIGHQKGRNTKENVKRNFGMARPEGYRKALRIMNLAERFSLPIITFIDTPGAYPGMDAEERGQSEAIAKNILVMSRLSVPIISVVIGEGGSGGALAIGVANRVLMMEYATYSVITPEGCASILWKDASKADRAAHVLGLTATTALKNRVIDGIIPEPIGGAHWNPKLAIETLGNAVEKHLQEIAHMTPEELREDRKNKFFHMGQTQSLPLLASGRSENPVNPQWALPWEHFESADKI